MQKKTKHMSCHHNADQNCNIKISNRSFENVSVFKYLGIALSSWNGIHDETKGRLHSSNSWYHSVQNRLSLDLISVNIKIKVYTTVILLFLCMSVQLGPPC
jgi:hypothetical protein